jgi:hypothetical protein
MGSDISVPGSSVGPFYTCDYITFLTNNTVGKVAFIAGKNALLGYVNNDTSDQTQFDPNKVEAINLGNAGYNNVSFYGVTV